MLAPQHDVLLCSADVVFCTKPTAGDYNMTFDTAQIENGRCSVAYPDVPDCIDLTSVILRCVGCLTLGGHVEELEEI